MAMAAPTGTAAPDWEAEAKAARAQNVLLRAENARLREQLERPAAAGAEPEAQPAAAAHDVATAAGTGPTFGAPYAEAQRMQQQPRIALNIALEMSAPAPGGVSVMDRSYHLRTYPGLPIEFGGRNGFPPPEKSTSSYFLLKRGVQTPSDTVPFQPKTKHPTF